MRYASLFFLLLLLSQFAFAGSEDRSSAQTQESSSLVLRSYSTVLDHLKRLHAPHLLSRNPGERSDRSFSDVKLPDDSTPSGAAAALLDRLMLYGEFNE